MACFNHELNISKQEIKLSYSIENCIGLFLKGGPVELCLMQCLTNESDRQ